MSAIELERRAQFVCRNPFSYPAGKTPFRFSQRWTLSAEPRDVAVRCPKCGYAVEFERWLEAGAAKGEGAWRMTTYFAECNDCLWTSEEEAFLTGRDIEQEGEVIISAREHQAATGHTTLVRGVEDDECD
jgi:hypothetical protein